jgi:hypothetical protein
MEARGFDIYRSAIDTPSSGFAKIGSVDTGVNEFVDRKAELGSTYGYKIVAKNSSGFANHFDSKVAQQLQYPADPTITPLGQNGTRDLDKFMNRVMWSASKSANSYVVLRDGSEMYRGAALTLIDHAVEIKASSRFTYSVYAKNMTGDSPRLDNSSVVVTQRPAAPDMKRDIAPNLNSTTTKVSWTHTGGKWCVPGAYEGKGDNCAYEQRQYAVNGSLRHAATEYVTSFNWGNQDWGRHYTYDVRAQNAAITNGGWSEPSNGAEADTYPGNFGVAFVRGDNSGNQSQRFMYNSSFITTNTSETDHTREFNGAAHTSIAWGTPAGSRTVLWERFPEAGGANVSSTDKSLALPASTYLSGWVDWAKSNVSTQLAAPGAQYGARVTAWSVENNLTRSINSASSVLTPADMPQSGFMQVVCSGPWDATPAGYGQAAAIEYAKRSFASQSYGSRLQSLNKAPRYGWYSDTVIQGRQQDASGVGASYWSKGPDGRFWFVEKMAKGQLGYYQYGNGIVRNWDQGNPNGFDGQSIGQATHRYNVGHGFTLYNRINNDPHLNSYWMFILMDEAATRGGCGDNKFVEPYDACYEWSGTAGCFQLNQNGTDGRPRWTTK